MANEYNKWFLVVDGGSGLQNISAHGTQFPTGTADLDNSYLREAAITLFRFRGCHRNAPLQARNLAKTIARDTPGEYFECSRKLTENKANMTKNNKTFIQF